MLHDILKWYQITSQAHHKVLRNLSVTWLLQAPAVGEDSQYLLNMPHLKMLGVAGMPRSSKRYSSSASLACRLLVVSLAELYMKMVFRAALREEGGYVMAFIPCSASTAYLGKFPCLLRQMLWKEWPRMCKKAVLIVDYGQPIQIWPMSQDMHWHMQPPP